MHYQDNWNSVTLHFCELYTLAEQTKQLKYSLALCSQSMHWAVCNRNMLLFLPGQFAGFDESEPTSRSGGKTFVVGLVKQKHDT